MENRRYRRARLAHRRLDAAKRVGRAETRLLAEDGKKGLDDYVRRLAREVYQALRHGGRPEDGLVLIHSRFRRSDREEKQNAISGQTSDEIVVAAQAIEAGVDVTSAVLFTELAPWASLVQRFERCNREGELNDAGGAEIHWVDAAVEEAPDLARPYDAQDLIAARGVVARLEYAAPRGLPPADRGPEAAPVLRLMDSLELFDTDPDLS